MEATKHTPGMTNKKDPSHPPCADCKGTNTETPTTATTSRRVEFRCNDCNRIFEAKTPPAVLRCGREFADIFKDVFRI